jgi:hypothetical protein
MALPVPIKHLATRGPQEAGKIKIGKKTVARNGKVRPVAIDTFRFFSPDQAAIEQLAELYGGTVEFNKEEGKWEVITTHNEIDVVLPQDALRGPIYELWEGGGLKRRCTADDDEATPCTLYTEQGDDIVEQPTQCLCWANQALACKPTTILSVILPGVRLGGVWRLRSGSEAAAAEMTTFVDIIHAAQAQGLTKAKLAITSRKSRGGRRQFKVPTLRLDVTVQEMLDGGAALKASELTAPTAAAIGPALAAVPPADESIRHELNAAYKALEQGGKDELLAWVLAQGWDMKRLTIEQATATHERISALADIVDAEVVDDI